MYLPWVYLSIQDVVSNDTLRHRYSIPRSFALKTCAINNNKIIKLHSIPILQYENINSTFKTNKVIGGTRKNHLCLHFLQLTSRLCLCGSLYNYLILLILEDIFSNFPNSPNFTHRSTTTFTQSSEIALLQPILWVRCTRE